MDALTWIEFIMTLQQAFGVRPLRSQSTIVGPSGPESVPYLERTLPDGTVRRVVITGADGNRPVPPSRMRTILDRLEIDPAEFEKV